MTENKTYRYPGIRSFTKDDSHIFYGRNKDIEQLAQFISLEKMVALYGKSGLGKTSLLNAGVVPHFIETGKKCKVTNIRFGNYIAADIHSDIKDFVNLTPVQKFKDAVIGKPDEAFWNSFVSTKITKDTNSLWSYFKCFQSQQPDIEHILIFDQFEELFTYQDSDIEAFKNELAALLYGTMPTLFKVIMNKAMATDRDFFTSEEIDFVYQPLKIRIVLAIRTDRLSFLDRLSDRLPTILQNCYELKPLENEDAEQAIVEPAMNKTKKFSSPDFTYDSSALKAILNFLSENGKKKIESFQLQIICQYCENIIIERKSQNGSSLKLAELGDLKNIFKNYYDSQILKIEAEQRANARRLIEDELILDQNRMSLPEAIILKKNITKKLLTDLVNNFLLRAEPNTVGGISYELSHDTLVAPILEARTLRVEEEGRNEELRKKSEELRLAQEKAKQEKLERETERKRQRKIIIIVGAAAVISATLAVIAVFQMVKANTLSEKIKVEQFEKSFTAANQLKELAQYKAAIRKYNDAYELKTESKVLDSIKVCEKKLISASDFEAIMSKGEELYKNFEFVDALAYYNKALETSYDDKTVRLKLSVLREVGGLYYYKLAKEFHYSTDRPRAKKYIEIAKQLNPVSVKIVELYEEINNK